jgi:hypothetical protein
LQLKALLVAACHKEKKALIAAEGAARGCMPQGKEGADCS